MKVHENMTKQQFYITVDRGKGDSITVEGIGGETITSNKSEKLLGLHINSNFDWSTHIRRC